MNINRTIIEYAVRHLEEERDAIQARIDHATDWLNGQTPELATTQDIAAIVKRTAETLRQIKAPAIDMDSFPGKKKRTMTAKARKAIAAAQKARWAKWHADKKKAAK